MESIRQNKIARLLQKELAEIFQKESKNLFSDPIYESKAGYAAHSTRGEKRAQNRSSCKGTHRDDGFR